MKMIESKINEILDRLLHSTDTSLKNVQRAKCPHHVDLKHRYIENGVYLYDDNKVKTLNALFRIGDLKDIKNENRLATYIGPIINLFANKLIKPFILFVNGQFIHPNNVNFITDNRNTFIEIIDFNKIDFSLGADTSVVLNGPQRFTLPKVPDILKPYINLTITSSNPISMMNLTLNDTPITLNNIPKELFKSDKPNILKFNAVNTSITRINLFTNNEFKLQVPITDVKCIVFPDDIELIEVMSKSVTDNIDFLFRRGLHYSKEDCISLPLESRMIGIKYRNRNQATIYGNTVTDSNLIMLPQDPKYKIQLDTLFTFSDGYPIDNITNHHINTFSVDAQRFSYKAYYYKGNESVDNITKYNTITNLLEKILHGNVPIHIDKIINPLDFTFNPELSMQERIVELVIKICEHNSYLLQDYIDYHSNIEVINYTGQQIKELSDFEDGAYTFKRLISYDNKDKSDIIVFKNGELYDVENISYTYLHIAIMFDENTNDEDNFDFMVFNKVRNEEIEITIDPNDNKYLIANYIPFSELILLTHDIDNHIYKHIQKKEELQYEVQYQLEDLGDGYVKIDLPEYYDDKKVFLSSRRKFLHETYYVTGDEMLIEDLYKILLPDKFRYCTNMKQFLIFHNNRKVDNGDAFVCLNKWNLPFDKRFIHTTKKCTMGDKIDIFYVPDEMVEVFTDDIIESHGYVEVDKAKLEYNLDTLNSSIFINGKRISEKNIETVSTSAIKLITDIESQKNISVVRHIGYSDDIFKLMGTVRSAWDEMVSGLSPEELDELFDFESLTLTDTESDIKENSYTKQMVLYEIIRRYWLINPNKIMVENPAFYITEVDGTSVISINSSIEMIDILKILKNKFANIDSVIDINDQLNMPLDALNIIYPYNDLNSPNYQEYYQDGVTVTYVNSDNETPDYNIIKMILENANDEIISTYGGIDNIPIDALKEYWVKISQNTIPTYNCIDASIIVPYFFNDMLCLGEPEDYIRPIPIDASLPQISPLYNILD